MNFAWLFVAIIFDGCNQLPDAHAQSNDAAGIIPTETDFCDRLIPVSGATSAVQKPLTHHDQPNGEPRFDTEIIPILTKAGCNSGACHGAAAGRSGFRLSLFGSDPASDYDSIVHQFEGRRVNLARAERSLLLKKPSGELNHEGGTPLLDDPSGREIMLKWIQSGAKRGLQRRLVALNVEPRRKLLASVPAAVTLNIVATFDDQTSTNVTYWTVFTASDPSAIRIEGNGPGNELVAHIARRGQHIVMARYLDQTVPITITVPMHDAAVDHSKVTRVNFVDVHILKTLEELRIPLSLSAGESAWLRRVSLDVSGRLPSPEEVTKFLADSSDDKREQVVDRLMSSEGYVDLWTLHFSRLLRMHSLPNETQPLETYTIWLRDAIQTDRGFDHLARELLTATGDSHIIGPANFGRMVPDARTHAELVGQFFAGIRLGCANCHNHPLDRWTQDDYHGLAAVFAPLNRGRDVKLSVRGQVTNRRTGEPATPRIPGMRDLTDTEDRLNAVVDWVTNDTDLLFARATVNRLWRHMFGRGLVEPTDDLRNTNPATHPELLKALARDFAANGYRLRPTLKTIVLSSTYGRSDQTFEGNHADDRFYSHAIRRPLEPEVLLDAISDVTGSAGLSDPHPATRAVQVIDMASPNEALDVLGRCQRIAGCSEGESRSGSLATQLHLLNGDAINRRLRDPSGRLQKLIMANRPIVEIIDEFYLRALGRPPFDN
ncbi:MAG: DUF1549 domain-containing protein, partial [Planctomycetota bacterium]